MFEPLLLETRRPNWRLRAACAALALFLVAGFVWIWRVTQMPLESYKRPLPPLSDEESQLATRLSAHVKYMSQTVGERSIPRLDSLRVATDYLCDVFRKAGYVPKVSTYSVGGHSVSNIEANLIGGDNETGIVIVGAHYDSIPGTVGADDNATGVAGTLELARMLRGGKLTRTVRFVLFVNEEPPYFQTSEMGSVVFARQLRRDRVPVSAMISLEMLGFYSDTPGSQKYPSGLSVFYPSRGDFISFVGNEESRDLVRRSIRSFRASTNFPSEGIAAPANWPGVGWSDHWAFWQQQYPAIMITDTAMFRNPYYHTPRDTVEHIDFERMARVVGGVRQVVESLANER